MTLHQLFALASKRVTVAENCNGITWQMLPMEHKTERSMFFTRAEAHKAAAPYRVLFCLTHTYPRRNVEALRAAAERHTRNGGDWRDCARAAINNLKEGAHHE